MGRTETGSYQARSMHGISIMLVPVHLTEQQNTERLSRLAKKILQCIEQGRRSGRIRKEGDDDDAFSKDYDEIFGLK